MINELIFITHTLSLTALTLLNLRLGREALIALIALYGVLANLFVTKQIVLLGLDVTASDAFTVAGIIGLNLVQEYFGSLAAKKAIWISFISLITYTFFSQLHLAYLPSSFDTTQSHFCALLDFMPRLAIASCFVYLLVQYLDRFLYGWLQQKCGKRYFLLRNYASLIVCQLIDTVLFSFLGLYGLVHNVLHIIVVSYGIKLIAIALSTPLLLLTKKIYSPAQSSIK